MRNCACSALRHSRIRVDSDASQWKSLRYSLVPKHRTFRAARQFMLLSAEQAISSLPEQMSDGCLLARCFDLQQEMHQLVALANTTCAPETIGFLLQTLSLICGIASYRYFFILGSSRKALFNQNISKFWREPASSSNLTSHLK